MIAQARRMTEEVGRRPATAEEARGLLGIKAPAATSAGRLTPAPAVASPDGERGQA